MDRNQGIRLGLLTGYNALLLDPSASEDLQTVEIIRNEVSGVVVLDQIESQLRDLIKLQHPKKPLTDEEYKIKIAEKLGATQLAAYGTWVYYPWRRTLVHLLPREEFIRVRTIRNAYKITFEEQAQLRTKKIGIIGLSVGQSAALAVAIERAAGELRIADFDTLELSNLNRIRSSVCNIGLPKTHLVAREIAELDPYLPVKVFDAGITEENIEAFLTEDGALDLLIEECDSVDIKVLSREYARKHRIPVLMDTSDRGMIDVERYDLDPEYPMLHGLLDPSVDYAFLKTLKTSEEKLPYIAPILGIDTMSIRLRASALEVGQTISTWPQLGGDVMHGGALCVHHAKEILLGRSTKSFRRFADELEDGQEDHTEQEKFTDAQILHAIRDYANSIIWANNAKYLDISKSLFENLVTAGSRASTPGNSQAFKWHITDNTIFLASDRSFSMAFSDNFGFGSCIGYGCVLDNLELKANSIGLRIDHRINNNFKANFPNVIFAIRLVEDYHPNEIDIKLANQIERRETTRMISQNLELTPTTFELIQEIAQSNNCNLIQDQNLKSAIYGLTLAADVVRMTNPKGYHDLFKEEIIWTQEDYEKNRDGIFIEDLQLNIKERVGIELYKNAKVNSFINEINGGAGFSDLSKKYLTGEPLMCIFYTNSFDLQDLIQSGRNIQRFWLWLTLHNLSLHPFTSSIMLSSYLHEDKNNYLKKELKEFSKDWDSLMELVPSERKPIFIAKITPHSGRELAKSLRRNLEQNIISDAHSNY